MVTIFHALFVKSFELLHVPVPVCHGDCSSLAHHLGPLTLELNRPTAMLKYKHLIHLRVVVFFLFISLLNQPPRCDDLK